MNCVRVLLVILTVYFIKLEMGVSHTMNDHQKQTMLQEEEGIGEEAGFVAELIHPDARSSHLRSISIEKLPQERLKLAVQRSNQRLRILAQHSKHQPGAQAAHDYAGAGSSNDGFMSSGQKARVLDVAPDDGAMITATVSIQGGLYAMPIMVGTPGQLVYVTIDTGSDLLWIQCADCIFCYKQIGPRFERHKSLTYIKFSCGDPKSSMFPSYFRLCEPTGCKLNITYRDLTNFEGDCSSDTITLTSANGNPRAISNVLFSCVTITRNVFGEEAGGLIGLAPPFHPTTFLAQLQKSQDNIRFAYCLVEWEHAMQVTSRIYFGGATDQLNITGMQSTPLNSRFPYWYVVNLEGISVGGSQVTGFVARDAMFDSGSILSYLDFSAYTDITTMFMNYIPHRSIPNAHELVRWGVDPGVLLCYYFTPDFYNSVPPLTLHFLNADFSPPASNYFMQFRIKSGLQIICLAILPTHYNVKIGNTMQQNYLVKHDAYKISFAPTNCSTISR